MAQHVEQVRTVSDDGSVTNTTRRVDDDTSPADEPATYTAARVIWFIAGVIITLLTLRFLLVLLGANQANGFVSLIYSLSYPFAVPFFGIFSYNVQYGIARFEVSTLVAIAIYALIAWGLERLVTLRRRTSP